MCGWLSKGGPGGGGGFHCPSWMLLRRESRNWTGSLISPLAAAALASSRVVWGYWRSRGRTQGFPFGRSSVMEPTEALSVSCIVRYSSPSRFLESALSRWTSAASAATWYVVTNGQRAKLSFQHGVVTASMR